MTEVAVDPFDMKDVDLIIGADNYKQHASRVRLEPTGSPSSWHGLAPNAVHRGQGDWQANLSIAQDWDNPASLCRYLYDNEGDVVTVEFRPRSGETGFSASMTLVAPAVGGDYNATATSDVTCPLGAKPTILPAVP